MGRQSSLSSAGALLGLQSAAPCSRCLRDVINCPTSLCVTSLPSPAQSTQAFGSPFLQESPCQVSPTVMVLSPLQSATLSGTEGTGHMVATTDLVPTQRERLGLGDMV